MGIYVSIMAFRMVSCALNSECQYRPERGSHCIRRPVHPIFASSASCFRSTDQSVGNSACCEMSYLSFMVRRSDDKRGLAGNELLAEDLQYRFTWTLPVHIGLGIAVSN